MSINTLTKIGLIAFIALFINISFGFSQKKKDKNNNDEEPAIQNRSWSLGINCGGAFASRYQANFYNGADGNQNELSYILNNPYYKEEIKRVLNDTFALDGMPTRMKYNPALAFGFLVKKHINNNVGVFIQFNYSKFTAQDQFTLKLGATSTSAAFPNLKNYAIWGKEERINIDFGVSGEILLAPKIYGFLEGGFNLNNTRVLENKIQIESLEYSIINIYGGQQYIPNTQLQEYKVHEGGIGIGAFLSPGVEFRFNDNVAVDILGSIYWSKINLMHYNSFKPQYAVTLRFMFSTQFVKSL
ncbi:MAG: hypothetical protein WCQ95_06790 [Bacteroidota bacterium]